MGGDSSLVSGSHVCVNSSAGEGNLCETFLMHLQFLSCSFIFMYLLF